jgi:hypothetical protein
VVVEEPAELPVAFGEPADDRKQPSLDVPPATASTSG